LTVQSIYSNLRIRDSLLSIKNIVESFNIDLEDSKR
jgi:hypothetical protein